MGEAQAEWEAAVNIQRVQRGISARAKVAIMLKDKAEEREYLRLRNCSVALVTASLHACENIEDVDDIRSLVAQRADPNWRGDDGDDDPPLMQAT